MWLLYAVGSAFFAGITSILAKCGIKKTDSTVATAIRTVVVLIFSWIMVFIVGSADTVSSISPKTLFFLVLSGLATGASWLCYFKALQIGNINKVVAVDKSSTVLTVILSFIILDEGVDIYKLLGIILIALGTFLMLEKRRSGKKKSNSWLLFAAGSAIFASLTAILGKIGIEGVESNLGTALRTFVVLIMAWVTVLVSGKKKEVKSVNSGELIFIILSGFATGASWLCYYKALQAGNTSAVVSIDKLSIVISVLFSYFVFKEKLTKKPLGGLIMIIAGTFLMIGVL